MPPKFKRHLDEREQRVHLMGDAESDGNDEVHHQREAKGPYKDDDSLSRVQGQVKEVIGVMQTNIGKVLDRGDRLEDLQDKTDDLAAGALTFHKSATKLQKKLWWKNMKIRICFILAILLVIGVVVVSVIMSDKGGVHSEKPSQAMP